MFFNDLVKEEMCYRLYNRWAKRKRSGRTFDKITCFEYFNVPPLHHPNRAEWVARAGWWFRL